MKRKIKDPVPVNMESDLVSVDPDSPKPTNGKPKTKIKTAATELSDELDMSELLKVLSAVKNGDFSARMPIDRIGLSGKICDIFNEIAHVISSVAKGNLSQEMPLRIGDHLLLGEFAKIATEVNDMVKQLNLFSMEVTRVAREVGSEGKLGGQAKVKGVAGVWKDLTDSVNQMAGNLTAQVRNIAEVTTAVAKGDLS